MVIKNDCVRCAKPPLGLPPTSFRLDAASHNGVRVGRAPVEMKLSQELRNNLRAKPGRGHFGAVVSACWLYLFYPLRVQVYQASYQQLNRGIIQA
jgi:hypothetical protein